MGQVVPDSDLPDGAHGGVVPQADMPGAAPSAAPAQPSADAGKLGPYASAAVRPAARLVASAPLMAADAGVAGGNIIRSGIEGMTGMKPAKDMELPSETFEKFLDKYTVKPKGIANKAAEGVSSMLTGGIAKGAGKMLGLAGEEASAMMAPQETVKQGSYRAARSVGYRVAPSEQEGGSSFWKNVQSASGGTKVEKEISAHNSERHDSLARNALGLPEGHPLTEETTEQVRDEAGRAYERLAQTGDVQTDQNMIDDIVKVGMDVEKLEQEAPGFNKPETMKELDRVRGSLLRDKFNAGTMIKMVRQLRKDSRSNFKSADDPTKQATGAFQRQAADLLESRLERHAEQMGDPEMVNDVRNARRLIARSYVVEDALNSATGHIDARTVARLGETRALDGDLKSIANFAQAFPRSSQNIDKVGSGHGITRFEFLAAAGAFAHHPGLTAAAVAEPGMRAAARSSLSQPKTLAKAATGAPNAIKKGIEMATGEEAGKQEGEEQRKEQEQ